MAAHPPHPDQQTLDRGMQLRLLRDCRLGNPRKRNDYKLVAKSMLRAIGDRINRQTGTWTMYPEDLFEELEVARSTGYKWLAWLCANGLLISAARSDGQHTMEIVWSTLEDYVPDECGQIPAFDSGDCQERDQSESESTTWTTSPPRGPRVHHVDHESTTWTTSPPNGLHIRNSALLPTFSEISPSSSPSSSPEKPPDEIETAAVVNRLANLGINQPSVALEKSIALRSLAETRAILEFYESNFVLSDGFRDSENSPGFLFWRLTSHAALPHLPSGGWKEPSAAFRSRRQTLANQAKLESDRQAWRARAIPAAETDHAPPVGGSLLDHYRAQRAENWRGQVMPTR